MTTAIDTSDRDQPLRLYLESDALASDVGVVEYRGRERLGRCFLFELSVHAGTAPLDVVELVGASVRLRFERRGDIVRWVHGLVTQCEDRLDAVVDGFSYRLSVRPNVWRARMVHLTDIQMDRSVPEIVAHKLGMLQLTEDRGFDLRLIDEYDEREFVVQHREDDLAFVSRLCEHVGIWYFFEQDEDVDLVVFADHNDACAFSMPQGKASYVDRAGDRGVFSLSATSRMLPGRYIQRDYNYRTPAANLLGSADLEQGHGGGVYEYGSHVKDSAEATRIARVRAEEQAAASQLVYAGESNLIGLVAGMQLEIAGHPSGPLRLLVTEVDHEGQQGMSDGREQGPAYENHFRAIPADVPFRPARITPKPSIHGFLSGIIESADDSDYADVDAKGRYRVRFLFDAALDGERQASRPIRMMQPHAGPGYGMHFPLRGGVEVLIGFVGGDPDRPVIAGTVPNAQIASPVAATNRERNVIRTGGGNEINIDDTRDAERIKITVPQSKTVFQLGAANDPFEGASLRTTGINSTISEGGASEWTGWRSTISGMLDAIYSSHVVNVAANFSFLPLLTHGVNEAGVAICDLLYVNTQIARDKIKEKEAEAIADAKDESDAAEALQEECRLCVHLARERFKAGLDERGLDTAAEPAALSDFVSASLQNDNAFSTLLGTLEDRNGIVDVNRENFANPNFENVMERDALQTIADYDRGYYEDLHRKSDLERWEEIDTALSMSPEQFEQALADGDDDRARRLQRGQAGAQGIREAWADMTEAERSAYQDVWLEQEKQKWIPAGADPSSATTTPEEVGLTDQAELDDYREYLSKLDKGTAPTGAPTTSVMVAFRQWQLEREVDDLKESHPSAADLYADLLDRIRGEGDHEGTCTCCKDVAQSRDNAVTANEEVARTMRTNSIKLHELQDIDNANNWDIVKNAGGALNTVMWAMALWDKYQTRDALLKRWASTKRIAEKTPDLALVTACNRVNDELEMKFWDKALELVGRSNHNTHVVGSNKSTELYGKRDLLMWSEDAMILGIGTKKDDAAKKKAALAAAAALIAAGGGAAGFASGSAEAGSTGAGLALVALEKALVHGGKPDEETGSVKVLGVKDVTVASPEAVNLSAGKMMNLLSGGRFLADITRDKEKKKRSAELAVDETGLRVRLFAKDADLQVEGEKDTRVDLDGADKDNKLCRAALAVRGKAGDSAKAYLEGHARNEIAFETRDDKGKALASLKLTAEKTANLLAAGSGVRVKDGSLMLSVPNGEYSMNGDEIVVTRPDGGMMVDAKYAFLGHEKKVVTSVGATSHMTIDEKTLTINAKSLVLKGEIDAGHLTVKGEAVPGKVVVKKLVERYEKLNQGN